MKTHLLHREKQGVELVKRVTLLYQRHLIQKMAITNTFQKHQKQEKTLTTLLSKKRQKIHRVKKKILAKTKTKEKTCIKQENQNE